MFMRLLRNAPPVLLTMAIGVWAFGWGDTSAHAGEPGHDHPAASAQPAPPHSGQLKEANPFNFEVVYLPREIRVYLYGDLPNATSAKGVSGEVSLARRNDKRATQLALRYVAQPAGQQDYLSARADLSRVKDRELVATITLKNLPGENHPEINFAQPVIVAHVKPRVSVASLHASDRAGIARQKVCPVSGEQLGGMGQPVKVLIDGRPLYLCCKGCLAKVQSDPETYLRKAAQASQAE